MPKITKATVKSFIKKNQGNLFINVKSEFDGMTDGCERRNAGFVPAKETWDHLINTLGVQGAWFVDSRNSFRAYEDETFAGIDVYNCCGSFVLAVKKGGK
jgi:hypothetical protein